jgi:phosphoribosylpyrophosphate synthetase
MIIEGIRYNKETDSFDFIWKEDVHGDLIDLKLQKYNKLLSKKDGNKVYYSYKFNKDQSGKNLVLRKSIKYIDDKVSKKDVELMVSKAVVSFNSIVPLSSFDLIVTPSSTSTVLDLLRNFLHAKAGSNTLVSSDLFVKNTIDNIELDEEKLNKIEKSMQNKIRSILNKAFSKEDYKLRSIPPRYRKFIFNFIKFNTEAEKRVLNAIVNGKILVVDDILTEGTTIKNINKLLYSAGAEEIVSFVLLTDK